MSNENQADNVELATELTIAWLNNPNNRASTDDVPGFLTRMHATLVGLQGTGPAEEQQESGQAEPAVSVRKSLASPDFIISMIDGKPYKSLKRHLTTHGLTPIEYRQRYGLKPDYPMVAPNYAEQRRNLALKIGLGSKGRAARAEKRAVEAAPKRPGRKPAAKAPAKPETGNA